MEPTSTKHPGGGSSSLRREGAGPPSTLRPSGGIMVHIILHDALTGAEQIRVQP
jgi:hypothetical protein